MTETADKLEAQNTPPQVTKKEIKKNNTGKNRVLSVVMLVILVLGIGFVGGWLGSSVRNSNPNALSGNTEQARRTAEDQSQLISSIAKDVGPSVVSINVTSQGMQTDLFGGLQRTQQQSAGTGFFVSSDGYIVTNRHVVPQGTTTVSITLSDGTQLDNVQVVGRTGTNDSLDIAFLKVKDLKGHKITPVKLGDSSKMQVGNMVVAIGNALGQFQNTVTSGIISGYGRSVQAQGGGSGEVENLENLFQTDAAINEGNSGGPLVNADGEVIGINTAVAGGAQNIGFAIPINDVKGLVKSVLNTGKVERPYLGVHYVSLTDDYAYQYNLKTKRGAYIVPDQAGQPSIVSGSPAEKANLQPKDIIVKVDDQAIDENNSLTSVLSRYAVGDKVTLTVERDGKTITVDATLAKAPQS